MLSPVLFRIIYVLLSTSLQVVLDQVDPLFWTRLFFKLADVWLIKAFQWIFDRKSPLIMKWGFVSHYDAVMVVLEILLAWSGSFLVPLCSCLCMMIFLFYVDDISFLRQNLWFETIYYPEISLIRCCCAWFIYLFLSFLHSFFCLLYSFWVNFISVPWGVAKIG